MVGKSDKNKTDYAIFLSTWFDLGFYIALVPIRFKQFSNDDEGTKLFEIHTSKSQKFMCGLANTFAIIIFWNQTRNAFSEIQEQDPVTYLRLFFRIATLVHHIVFVELMWNRSQTFLHVINILIQTRNGSLRSQIFSTFPPKVPCKRIVALVLLIYPIVSLATAQIFTSIYNDPETSVKRFVYQIRFSVFMESKVPSDDIINEEIQKLLPHHYILAFIFLVAFSCRSVMGFCTDAMIFMVCVSLWFPVRQFSNALSHMGKNFYEAIPMSPADVFSEYEQLKTLSKSLNKAFQSFFFTFVLQGLLFYSTSLKSIFCSTISTANMWLIMSFLSFSVIFLIAIDTCHQTEVFKEWLWQGSSNFQNNLGTLTQRELHCKLYELQVDPIGHSGGGIFMINYSFFAQMCGTLLTYFMVTVQSDKVFIR